MGIVLKEQDNKTTTFEAISSSSASLPRLKSQKTSETEAFLNELNEENEENDQDNRDDKDDDDKDDDDDDDYARVEMIKLKPKPSYLEKYKNMKIGLSNDYSSINNINNNNNSLYKDKMKSFTNSMTTDPDKIRGMLFLKHMILFFFNFSNNIKFRRNETNVLARIC